MEISCFYEKIFSMKNFVKISFNRFLKKRNGKTSSKICGLAKCNFSISLKWNFNVDVCT